MRRVAGMSALDALQSLAHAVMIGATANYLRDGALVPILALLRSPQSEIEVIALPQLPGLAPEQRRAALCRVCNGALAAVLVAESDDEGVLVIGESADDRMAFYAAAADALPIRFAPATILVPGCTGFLKQPDA